MATDDSTVAILDFVLLEMNHLCVLSWITLAVICWETPLPSSEIHHRFNRPTHELKTLGSVAILNELVKEIFRFCGYVVNTLSRCLVFIGYGSSGLI